MIHDPVEQCRHRADEGGPDVDDLLQESAEVARVGNQRDRVVIDKGQTLNAGVAVRMKQWEGQHDLVGPLVHSRTKPGLKLVARNDNSAVGSDYSLRCSGCSSTHQDHSRVVETRCGADKRFATEFPE